MWGRHCQCWSLLCLHFHRILQTHPPALQQCKSIKRKQARLMISSVPGMGMSSWTGRQCEQPASKRRWPYSFFEPSAPIVGTPCIECLFPCFLFSLNLSSEIFYNHPPPTLSSMSKHDFRKKHIPWIVPRTLPRTSVDSEMWKLYCLPI